MIWPIPLLFTSSLHSIYIDLSIYPSITYFNSNISLWNFAFLTLIILFSSFFPCHDSLECASLSLSMQIVLILQGPTGGPVSSWSPGHVFHPLMTLFHELLLHGKEFSSFIEVQFIFSIWTYYSWEQKYVFVWTRVFFLYELEYLILCWACIWPP